MDAQTIDFVLNLLALIAAGILLALVVLGFGLAWVCGVEAEYARIKMQEWERQGKVEREARLVEVQP